MKKKKSISVNIFIGLLLAFIICIVVSLCVCSYAYKTINELSATQTDDTSLSDEEEEDDEISLDFDTSYIVNGNADSYTLASYDSSLYVSIDTTGMVATISYNRATLSSTYSLEWDLTDVLEDTNESQTITFAQKVKDVYYGTLGQDVTGDILLFLMEDGTVNYIPVYQTLSTTGVEGLVSYTSITDLTDVVKFYTVDATSDASGYVTVLAQTSNGSIYDLNQLINGTDDVEE